MDSLTLYCTDHGAGVAVASASPPKFEVNLNFSGNIILGGSNAEENAEEFISKIEPHLREAIWRYLRDTTDFSR
ncbi:hypothetical protein [Oscillatoria acuminata]|uniref:Uncharacterized protein n=1 Tax=Oscillatoria acuminata PCC 6304 TaxID=56110 RepID=K9TSW7_9CYAN|nr:hypothetical protein [Oscillatoria acuminata]AFY85503.1 hypothetical protein Oscil6304_6044 [Oscillatoria acuminata PCC 6304]